MGSSRSDGNTSKVVDYLISLDKEIDVLDLNDYKIGYYDYKYENAEDDFFPFYHTLVGYDTIIFATPVYWYTMSAQMKTFFDRISDVLDDDKKVLGRKLKGKQMAVVSCGADEEIVEGFEMPFEQSAIYLGMEFRGYVHTWLENDSKLSKKVKNNLQRFLKEI